jgi:ADP-heptose:LPS heptosyltransferase
VFSSPLLPVDRTWLPSRLREWVGRRLGGPPNGRTHHHWRAAIYQLDRLGDLVIASSAIRLLLAEWGEAECLLILSEAAAPLAAREFPRTPHIVLPTSAPSLTRNLIPIWWRYRRKLHGHRAAATICLSHHRDVYKQTALTWIAADQIAFLDRSTYPTVYQRPWSLELTAHRQLLSTVLGRQVRLEDVVPQLTSVVASDGLDLVVCPIGEERARSIPPTVLLESLRLWRTRSGAQIVLSGLPHQAAELGKILAALRDRGVANATIEVSDTFSEFLQRIAAAGAVLANDSAPAHLATALDKRLVLVPGGGRFGLISPWQRSSRQIVLEHRVPCYGCGWRCHQPEPFCLTRISPTEVAAALPALA